MDGLAHLIEDIERLRKKVSGIYIYGIGMYGQATYKALEKNNIKVDGFVVTDRSWGANELFSRPVYPAAEVIKKNVGLILGLNQHNEKEVRDYLLQNEFEMKNVISGQTSIIKGGRRSGFDEVPTIEVTTKIGCSVNCKYCPQKLLMNKYFEKKTNREYMFRMEQYRICLNKLPSNCNILFCGMSEPFLNPMCIEMMKETVKSGRRVDLYTTLVGLRIEQLYEMLEIPVGFVTLHVADKYGYAHIPRTKEYYEMVEIVLNYIKKDGFPYVNLCNAQTEPDDRIMEICKGKYEILTTMHDRAGNLEAESLLNKRNIKGMISCGVSGQKWNRNILLPDGTLLLCAMDYGMKHVLGNLLEDTYENIMSGKEMQRVLAGACAEESDILCRTCSFANQLVNGGTL